MLAEASLFTFVVGLGVVLSVLLPFGARIDGKRKRP